MFSSWLFSLRQFDTCLVTGKVSTSGAILNITLNDVNGMVNGKFECDRYIVIWDTGYSIFIDYFFVEFFFFAFDFESSFQLNTNHQIPWRLISSSWSMMSFPTSLRCLYALLSSNFPLIRGNYSFQPLFRCVFFFHFKFEINTSRHTRTTFGGNVSKLTFPLNVNFIFSKFMSIAGLRVSQTNWRMFRFLLNRLRHLFANLKKRVARYN